jgi:hypothetical protein
LQIHKQRGGNEKDTYKQLKSEQNIPYIRFGIFASPAMK